MDDDPCEMKYIEIVRVNKSEDNSNVTDVKCEPLNVKVGVVSRLEIILLLLILSVTVRTNKCIYLTTQK